MPLLDFGRGCYADPASGGSQEWLITNGLGGYASGTIAGFSSRRHHGLLIAALKPPLGRTLLLAKLAETAEYDSGTFPLYTDQLKEGVFKPDGFRYLERFHLEGATPTWTYALGDAQLEKRIWMHPGENTTYIHYSLIRATHPMKLMISALANFRDHHHLTAEKILALQVETVKDGLLISNVKSQPLFYLLSSTAKVFPEHAWGNKIYLATEAGRGLDHLESHLCVGAFHITLEPGDKLIIIASTQVQPELDGESAYTVRQAYETQLLSLCQLEGKTPSINQLLLAADQFIVKRSLPEETEGYSIIAGYPWFADWGRDAMISLPGLTLTSGRTEIARTILLTYAQYVNQGMLPNHFPEAGETPAYNTADATLWYFVAIQAYYSKTQDISLLNKLFPILEEIIP